VDLQVTTPVATPSEKEKPGPPAHSRGQFSEVIHRYCCQGATPTAPNFQPWIT
jgi:hypothetical protein